MSQDKPSFAMPVKPTLTDTSLLNGSPYFRRFLAEPLHGLHIRHGSVADPPDAEFCKPGCGGGTRLHHDVHGPRACNAESLDQGLIDKAGHEVRDGSGNLHRFDKWSFCLTAARMAAEQERR